MPEHIFQVHGLCCWLTLNQHCWCNPKSYSNESEKESNHQYAPLLFALLCKGRTNCNCHINFHFMVTFPLPGRIITIEKRKHVFITCVFLTFVVVNMNPYSSCGQNIGNNWGTKCWANQSITSGTPTWITCIWKGNNNCSNLLLFITVLLNIWIAIINIQVGIIFYPLTGSCKMMNFFFYSVKYE